jgi:hypothetical protein
VNGRLSEALLAPVKAVRADLTGIKGIHGIEKVQSPRSSDKAGACELFFQPSLSSLLEMNFIFGNLKSGI